jgi:hypothetical protein
MANAHDGFRTWGTIGGLTFAVAAFLLLSMGGAIFAAPITLPVMYLARRQHPTRGFRMAAVVLSGLTAAELVWALTYVAVREAKPWIWLLPIVGGVATGWLYSRPDPIQQPEPPNSRGDCLMPD